MLIFRETWLFTSLWVYDPYLISVFHCYSCADQRAEFICGIEENVSSYQYRHLFFSPLSIIWVLIFESWVLFWKIYMKNSIFYVHSFWVLFKNCFILFVIQTAVIWTALGTRKLNSSTWEQGSANQQLMKMFRWHHVRYYLYELYNCAKTFNSCRMLQVKELQASMSVRRGKKKKQNKTPEMSLNVPF